MSLWVKVLAKEAQNFVRIAEEAEESGELERAAAHYRKAASRYRQASDIAQELNEINRLRESSNYYYNCAHRLEKKLPDNSETEATQVVMEPPRKETITLGDLVSGTDIPEHVLDAVLKVALEISAEGREGHRIGTAFLVGDSAGVMARSRQLVLNPFKGYEKDKTLVTDPEIQNTIKEFAQLDGVFVISSDGAVEAAGRYITVDAGDTRLHGLGTRHTSVAAMTKATKSVGVVVSQSGGVIRLFRDGKLTGEVKPRG